ncbi:MAG: GAF domain-containing protein [Anaerolineae bacterium]|nr:GAF domain-containing protein [Anaerolineae bacterium]
MEAFATTLTNHVEQFTDELAQRLQMASGYADLPEDERREVARRWVESAAAGAAGGDPAQFVQALLAAQPAFDGPADARQQALVLLGETLAPAAEDAAAAHFLWRAIAQAQSALVQAAARQAEQSQHLVAMMMDSVPFGIVIIGPDKRIRRANRAALSMMGYEAEDQLVGRICHDTLCPATAGECPIFDLGQTVDLSERILITRNRLRVPILKSVARVTFEGEEALLEAFVDIAARKEAEEQLEKSLARLERQVQISVQVAQEIAATSSLDELFERVVRLIKERFNYYHAQIFRYDADVNAMVLVCGYGETGKKMLEEGHHLPAGRGVVGTAATTGESVLASDVTKDPNWVPNLHLPHTRGELAVPILLRGQMLGILDVQSRTPGALNEEDQLLLEGLGGEIAVAIESTQRLTEANVFRQFAEASNQGLGIATLDGTLIYANPALYSLVGVSGIEEFAGTSLLSYFTDETRDYIRQHILPTVVGGGSWMGELNIVSAKGRVKPTIQNIFPIKDEKGNALYIANTITDIGERKQAEQTLRESEAKHRLLMNSIQSPILALRNDLTVLYCNDAYADFVGLPVSALEGHDLLMVLPEFQQTQSFEAFMNTLETGKPSEAEGQMGDRYLQTQVYPIPWGALAIAEDITNRKLTESTMRETMRELENLYRSMSREGWKMFHHETEERGYIYDDMTVAPAGDLWSPEVGLAVERHALVQPTAEGRIAAVPLLVHGETIGVLGVQIDPQHPLSEEELALVAAVSEQVSQTLEGARLFQQTQRALAQTDALYAGSDRVIRAISPAEALDAIVESTALQRFDCANVGLYDKPWEETPPDNVTIAAAWEQSGRAPRLAPDAYVPLARVPALQWLDPHAVTFVEDVATDVRLGESARRALVETAEARSVILLPLTAGGQTFGSIVAQSGTPVRLSEEEVRQIGTLADQAAIVIRGQMLFEQAQVALEEIRATHRLYVRQEWAEFVPTSISPIYERTQAEVAPLAEAILSREYGELNQAIAQAMVEAGRGAQRFSQDGRDALVVPIDLHGEIIGILGLHDETGRQWSSEEIELVEAVAVQMGLAMENARLLEATRSRATRDRLIADITTRVRASMDPESILRTAVRELGAALGTDRAFIQLTNVPGTTAAERDAHAPQEVDR